MMVRAKVLLLALCVFPAVMSLNAQSNRKSVYDSALVGDLITPAVSSILMPKSFTEVLLSNSLLTGNQYFLGNRSSTALNDRTSYLFNTLQITHGISKSGRLNIGLDISYRTGRVDDDRNSSPLKVFGNDGQALKYYARGFASLALRARYAVTKNKNFVIQHAFYIPFQNSTEDSRFLGDLRYALNTQFLYTKLLGRKVFLFGQGDVFVQFKNDDSAMNYSVPLNIYVTYILNRRLLPFGQLGMNNAFDKDLDLNSQSFTYGLGLQYQFSTMFTVNAFYNDTFAGKATTAWTSYNLGVRVVL